MSKPQSESRLQSTSECISTSKINCLKVLCEHNSNKWNFLRKNNLKIIFLYAFADAVQLNARGI